MRAAPTALSPLYSGLPKCRPDGTVHFGRSNGHQLPEKRRRGHASRQQRLTQARLAASRHKHAGYRTRQQVIYLPGDVLS